MHGLHGLQAFLCSLERVAWTTADTDQHTRWQEIFGEVEFSMPDRLYADSLKKINMTFLEPPTSKLRGSGSYSCQKFGGYCRAVEPTKICRNPRHRH